MRLNQWLSSIYIINKRWWLGWLVGDHSLLSEFEPYGIKFTNDNVFTAFHFPFIFDE
jgi:hypothetical protein